MAKICETFIQVRFEYCLYDSYRKIDFVATKATDRKAASGTAEPN